MGNKQSSSQRLGLKNVQPVAPPQSPAQLAPKRKSVTPSSPAARQNIPPSPSSSPAPSPSSSSTSYSRPAPSPSSQASPTGSAPPQVAKPNAPTPRVSNEDIISNWKLFNDLENREEADVLELSLFLDALSKYMPGMEDKKHGSSPLKGSGGSSNSLSGPPPVTQPSLGKTVSEQAVGGINISDMYVQSTELDETITLKNVTDMIESCKNGLKIPRHVIVRVVNEVITLLKPLPTLVEFTVAPANHVTIIGDLHGQLDDLLLIFRENGLPSESNPYLFNGDFVDRGDRGVEITILIYLFKLLYPNHVLINRGNHEEHSITHVFGFMKECETKYDYYVYELFCESFKWLPLLTLIDKRVLVVHGGVGRDLVALKDFNLLLDRTEYDLTRYREKPKYRNDKEPHRRMTMMRDLLWSDPKVTKGWEENKRGAGVMYGPDVVQRFMSKNKLALIVRSHECVPRGFDWPYQEKGMLVTLFSASNYCGKANNLGCFMRIPSGTQAKPAFFQYMASAESRDMAVANLDGLFSLIIEHCDDLMTEFKKQDKANSGCVPLLSWGHIMEEVLDLSLDWKALQPLLTALDTDGQVPYKKFLSRYNVEGGVDSASEASTADSSDAAVDDPARLKRRNAFNSLYRHRARLEALFRVLDRDGNGTITVDELESGIELLNNHLPAGMKAFSTNAMDFMRMMDFSHDNEININEFMEGFRINAKLTVHAKWKRARKKIKALSAIGALRLLAQGSDASTAAAAAPDSTAAAACELEEKKPIDNEAIRELTRVASGRVPPPVLTRHGSVQIVGPLADDQVTLEVDERTTTIEDFDDEEHENEKLTL